MRQEEPGRARRRCDGILRPIDALEIGDLVWSRHEIDHERDGCRPVTQTFAHATDTLIELEIVDETGHVERITTTPEHPFFVPDLGRFVEAGDLSEGDALIGASGMWLKVGSATWVQQSAAVFNVTVGEFHSYYVGEVGVWVHNKAAYIPLPSLDELSTAARRIDPADKGGSLTMAGRSLQKHGNRPGSAFPTPSGSPSNMNTQGQFVVDDILTSPHSTRTLEANPRFGEVIEVREPGGRGIRYTREGEFLHFLEPRH
ncbi:MAG: polymorphic toxin-type HINT domain-containing protein [Bradymonadaceae bacterium]